MQWSKDHTIVCPERTRCREVSIPAYPRVQRTIEHHLFGIKDCGMRERHDISYTYKMHLVTVWDVAKPYSTSTIGASRPVRDPRNFVVAIEVVDVAGKSLDFRV